MELDRKFGDEYRGAAVDIDIFANNVQTPTDAEQMEVDTTSLLFLYFK